MYENKILKPQDLIGIYGELAELIDLDNVITIYKHFKGQQVSFPTRLYTRDYILKQITANQTQPIKKLATQYGYSERRLRQLMNETKKQ